MCCNWASEASCKFGLGSSGGLQSKDDGDESQVGPASESDWAHRQRHPVRVKDCARCAFLEIGPQLRQGHGSYKHEVHGEQARTVWLTQRPSHLPGLWGVGCTFCALAAQRRADARGQMAKDVGALGSTGLPWRRCRGLLGRRDPLANTKWARYEIRAISLIAVRGVRQHAETLQHRRAAWAYFMPERADVIVSS